MVSNKLVFVTLLLAICCSGAPIETRYLRSLLGEPIFIENPEFTLGDEMVPVGYVVDMDGSYDVLNEPTNPKILTKRSIDKSSLMDLETAAGTNVLRPLFVYRQQVAYRQRVREANRRGNRFQK